MVDVLEVKLHPLIEVDFIATADLPKTGEAGLHGETAALPWVIVLNFARDGRARSDKAHVSHENVPELWKLVEAGLAQETPERRDARVVLHFEDGTAHFIVGLQ